MRFDGIKRIYGLGSERIEQAHVLVVGLGGVGSWAVEALARSGIGALTLADPDEVCVSNINRQIQAMEGTIGQSKTDALAHRVRLIHPECRVSVVQKFINETNIETLIDDDFDYVIDAIDGVMPKAGLIAHCHNRNLPLITCGGSGGKRDPSQIQVVDLADTCHDRLLAFVRKKLRHVFKFPATGPFQIPCVYSPEPVVWPEEKACAEPKENDLLAEAGAKLNCDGRLGALTFVTGAFGFHAAAHVVNALVEQK